MKNITVSVDDETYRRSRIKAAEQETSVSALVKQFLTGVAAGDGEAKNLAREEKALRERIHDFSAAGRLSRAELYHGRR